MHVISPYSLQNHKSLKSWLELSYQYALSSKQKHHFWDFCSLKSLLVPRISSAVPQSSCSHTHTNNHIHQCVAQCLCLLHTGCLSFREHVYWPDGLQGLFWPKQNGFECVEDPHQVREKVTRILNITFNAHHGSLCQSVLYVWFLFSF